MRFAPGLLACGMAASSLAWGGTAREVSTRELPAAPWQTAGTAPIALGVQSVAIRRGDEPLLFAPRPDAPRRGAAARGARLPLYAATTGPGCAGRWLMVGPLAWVCEDVVELSRAPAVAPGSELAQRSEALPHRYYFVGPDGSLGYGELAVAEEGTPDAELQPGFAVAVVTIAEKRPGDPFGLTTHGIWVPMRDLRPVAPAAFHGAELSGAEPSGAEPSGAEPNTNDAQLNRVFDFLWVVSEDAPLFERPGGRRAAGSLPRFERLRVLERIERHGRVWHRVSSGQWLKDSDVRWPRRADAPASVAARERWIDVDLEQQIATAYVGPTPVFATLVSTGKGRPGSPNATPQGEYRIWVKLASSDMDNLEDAEASRYYAMQSVPWVMYFEKGYGLHGAFWHRDFGRVRSHGCVNLAPKDAQRLFDWTSPKLPAGWTAAFPTEYEPGTLVRVR